MLTLSQRLFFMDGNLSVLGAAVQGTICSFLNMAIWQPLFAVKSYRMSGRGFPPLSHMYRGYGINVAADMSNQGVAFLSFRAYRKYIHNDKPMNIEESLTGGTVAGIVSAPLQGGCERVMIIQQLEKKPIGVCEVLKRIQSIEGSRGFLRALHVTMVRESINATCFFVLSQIFYERMIKRTESVQMANLVSYLGAGICGGILTTPADLIKTRLQSEIGSRKTILNIIQEVGYRNIFKGALVRSTTIGGTMMTLGLLSKEIPPLLPSCFQDDFVWFKDFVTSGRRPPKP
jgi:hypothetical protein